MSNGNGDIGGDPPQPQPPPPAPIYHIRRITACGCTHDTITKDFPESVTLAVPLARFEAPNLDHPAGHPLDSVPLPRRIFRLVSRQVLGSDPPHIFLMYKEVVG